MENVNEIKAKRRIGRPDSMRGIAFLMVMYSHLAFKEVSIIRFFLLFFLILFFFVSDCLFEGKQYFSCYFKTTNKNFIGLSEVIPFNVLERIFPCVLGNSFFPKIAGKNYRLWKVK